MSKKALITGITGQDGALLARYLLERGYVVYGIVRRTSVENMWRLRELGIEGFVNVITCDVTDEVCMSEAIRSVMPDEVYHLAGQSHVHVSFMNPINTFDVNTKSTMIILETLRRLNYDVKFYYAGSSEMFGMINGVANEDTPFTPVSPYAVSKVASCYLTRIYRNAYNMYTVCGILFNHESEWRGRDFVTRKISIAVARIHEGLERELRLGNIDARRDWGYAPEYIMAMHAMLQHDKPKDYVIATGKSHSVREFLDAAFGSVGLDWRDYVVIDKSLMRPLDPPDLVGDSRRAREELGWVPRVGFEEVAARMVMKDIERLKMGLPIY